LEREYCN